MRVEHYLTGHGRCPVDDCPDVYEVTVRTDRQIMVEDILGAVKALRAEPMTQEQWTAKLAERLSAEVETVGTHSGVRTRVIA